MTTQSQPGSASPSPGLAPCPVPPQPANTRDARSTENQIQAAERAAARPTPPADPGVPMATFARGPLEQLRITLTQFKGRFFVNLRVWKLNRAGDWWPQVDRFCTIRLHELDGAIDALTRLRDELVRAKTADGESPSPDVYG